MQSTAIRLSACNLIRVDLRDIRARAELALSDNTEVALANMETAQSDSAFSSLDSGNSSRWQKQQQADSREHSECFPSLHSGADE